MMSVMDRPRNLAPRRRWMAVVLVAIAVASMHGATSGAHPGAITDQPTQTGNARTTAVHESVSAPARNPDGPHRSMDMSASAACAAFVQLARPTTAAPQAAAKIRHSPCEDRVASLPLAPEPPVPRATAHI